MTSSTPKLILLLTPPILLISCYISFLYASEILGNRLGYLAGFIFYWFFWCFIIPIAVLGYRTFFKMFEWHNNPFGSPRWLGLLALSLPLLLGFGYAFPRALPNASFMIIFASGLLAIVNGTMEEILWRGTYVKVFKDSWVLGWLYPSIGFGIWHFAPQTIYVNQAPGGSLSLVFVAVITGLLWGWVAKQTGSIRMTILSHILFNFSGLGARIYFS